MAKKTPVHDRGLGIGFVALEFVQQVQRFTTPMTPEGVQVHIQAQVGVLMDVVRVKLFMSLGLNILL